MLWCCRAATYNSAQKLLARSEVRNASKTMTGIGSQGLIWQLDYGLGLLYPVLNWVSVLTQQPRK